MMTVNIETVFLVFSVVLFLLAAHPFTIYPLSLLLLKRRPILPSSVCETSECRVSILICAYNEEGSIEEKMENVVTVAADNNAEVLVYTDGCSDKTPEIVSRYSDRVSLIQNRERRGKSHGMNTLARHANGDILIFTDANVVLDTSAIAAAREGFRDPEVGCLCGNLVYTNHSDSSTAQTGSLYWRLEELIKDLESRTGSTMGADGSLFAIRAKLYRPVPVDIIDDMYTSMSILLDGHRVVRLPSFKAFERTTTKSLDEFRRKIRIACRAFNCHRKLFGQLLNLKAVDLYKYSSHKIVRWLTIFWLVLLVFSMAYLSYLRDVFISFSVIFSISLALIFTFWRFRLKVLSLPGEVLLAFTATGLGVLASLRGHKFQTWKIADSSRGT